MYAYKKYEITKNKRCHADAGFNGKFEEDKNKKQKNTSLLPGRYFNYSDFNYATLITHF